jgi:hypothetical protein
MTMTDRLTCAACGTRIPNGTATIRSRAFVQVAFHKDCYTVVRALAGIDFAALEDMPLTRRMMLAEVERMGTR